MEIPLLLGCIPNERRVAMKDEIIRPRGEVR